MTPDVPSRFALSPCQASVAVSNPHRRPSSLPFWEGEPARGSESPPLKPNLSWAWGGSRVSPQGRAQLYKPVTAIARGMGLEGKGSGLLQLTVGSPNPTCICTLRVPSLQPVCSMGSAIVINNAGERWRNTLLAGWTVGFLVPPGQSLNPHQGPQAFPKVTSAFLPCVRREPFPTSLLKSPDF